MEVRKFDENAVDDLVLLKTVSEDELVRTLEARFMKNEIYTYIGPVLVSVNPFQDIHGLYSKKLIQKYFTRYKYEVNPHVFASAEEAYRKLMSFGVDQCILVSGESGAGKTEAAKKLMEYVSEVSHDYAEVTTDKTVAQIKEALLKSNPVLEAFGNAKTLRNDNSSRFGKYMEIQMDYNGTPLGGKITNYLLEKPRVVHQTQGERNFHIFYQLAEGAPSSLKNEFNIKGADHYRILSESGATNVKGINDREWFEEMDEAMESVGIDRNMKHHIFSLVSAVMWLGNIMFTMGKAKGQDKGKVSTKEPVENAARLLQVSPKDLAKALTTRTRSSGRESVTSPITSVEECEKVRDALAKALYARMFQGLVDLINVTIHVEKAELNLGVLDIYGFEIFEHNSFEQLCINYCNEKLQQYFIELTLKAEQEEYRKEGIAWKDVKYFNNKIVCDLIEAKRPAGVIAYLDEECIVPRGSDGTYIRKMNQNLSNHPHYESMETRTDNAPTEFLIHHYAGDVTYSVEGMLDKNKDQLYRDLLVLAGSKSQSEFIRAMFPEGQQKQTSKRPTTAGTQFVKDMQALIETLSKCEPHYIRCIKSNDNKRARDFDRDRVIHQVRYLGLLENVRVRRAGFAYRQDYDQFVSRYKMLTEATWPHATGNPMGNTEWILGECSIGKGEYQLGKTKVFIKDPKRLFDLEKRRDKRVNEIVKLIQRAYRSWKARLYFQQTREESVHLLASKKRRRNSWVLYFLGDYLNCSFLPEVLTHMEVNDDRKVVFAQTVDVTTLGKKRNKETQVMIIAKSGILFMTQQYQLIQRIPFRAIDTFALSTFADGYMIVKLMDGVDKKGQPQATPSLILHSQQKAEITTVLTKEYKQKLGSELPLKFTDDITVTVMMKKGGLFGKKKPVDNRLTFSENENLPRQEYIAQLKPQRTKKDPGFDKNIHPLLNEIEVSQALGSRAPLQLDDPIPARVLEHTAAVHKGKKRPRNRRRRY